MRVLILALSLVLIDAAFPALAVNPNEVLADPVLESRARDISKGLRCLVCQNQSIDDSNADLARDLRLLVRERLVAGDTNDQVVSYIVSRYGDFVLLKPPFKASTMVLWIGPLFIAVLGFLAVILFFRRTGSKVVEDDVVYAARSRLTDEEKKRFEKLIGDDER